jgi:N-carbamoyl-L-amino-acid hydrolase
MTTSLSSPANGQTSHSPTLRVNGQRLLRSLMDLAAIGATPKVGVCRLALSDLD